MSIQVNLIFFGKVKIFGKILLEKHNNPIKKKQKFCVKS